MATYCNLTSDLRRVYADIEKYHNLKTLSGSDFEVDSGAVYKLENSGYYEQVFEDGAALTEGSNATLSASEFWYDSTNDILYVRMSDDAAPSTHTVEAGVDWNTLKTAARNDAQEILESLLSGVFVVPFQKIMSPDASANSRDYDYWITRATALLTCSLIVSQVNPEDPVAEKLYKQVDNPRFEEVTIEESPGLVQRILDGDIDLKIQRNARETGGYNIFEGSGNAATAYVRLTGRYTGTEKQVWNLKMDGAGVPGTATYKLSKDGGTNYDYTTQETRKTSSNDRRVYLDAGIYAEFVGTFVVDDEWDIMLYPHTDSQHVAAASSIGLMR